MDFYYYRVFVLNSRGNILVFKEFIALSLLLILFAVFPSKIIERIFIDLDIRTYSAKLNVTKISQTTN